MTVKCPECSQIIADGSIGWGYYHGPCPKCKKWVDDWIEIDQATGEPVRTAADVTATDGEKNAAHHSETLPSFKTEYRSVDQAQDAFARIRSAYPVVTPAFVPDGKTSAIAVVAMIFGSPVAWGAAAVCALLAGGLAGFLIGVAGKTILWFPSKIGFLRDFTNDYLDPLLMFLIKATVVFVGGYVTAVIVPKIVSAFGRLGKNRSVEAAEMVSVIATALMLGFTWYANMKLHPMFPKLLQGGWGIAVGILYAIGFAGMCAEYAAEAVKTKPFCLKCQQFTFVPRTVGVPTSLMASTRDAVQSGLLQPIAPIETNLKEAMGTLSWHECLGCGEGYLYLTGQNERLIASAHINGDGAKNAKAIFPPLPSTAAMQYSGH